MTSATALDAGRAVIKLSLKSDAMRGQLQKLHFEVAKIGDRFKSIGRAGLQFTAILAAPLAAMVKSASDAQEQLSKFKQVFGEQTEAASKFAQTLANEVGRSVFDVKDGLSTFQSFFKGLGFSGERSRELSQQLSKLAIDFASFHNLSDDEALQRFISALSGSSEVLDRFGVNIKQAALQEELLRQGIRKSWTEVTEQEKAIARLNIIMRGMGEQGAVGDAKRTAGSFANQLKALRGQMTEAAVTLGQALLPAATEFLQKIRDLVGVVAEWAKHHQKLVAELGKAIAVFGAASLAVYGLGTAFGVLSKAIRLVNLSLTALYRHPWIAALALATIAVLEMTGAFEKLADWLDVTAESSDTLAEEVDELNKSFDNKFLKRYNDELERFNKARGTRPNVPFAEPPPPPGGPYRLRNPHHPEWYGEPIGEFDLPFRPSGSGTRTNKKDALDAIFGSAATLGGLASLPLALSVNDGRSALATSKMFDDAKRALDAARNAIKDGRKAAEKAVGQKLGKLFGGDVRSFDAPGSGTLLGNKQFAKQILGGGQDEQIRLLSKIEKNTRDRKGGLPVA